LASAQETSGGAPANLPPLTAVRVAGRWPRLFAAVLDVAFLAMVGAIIGMLVGNRIAPAGTLGRFWGLLIAVPYFAVFGRTYGGGQTFGKTLLHIRVVNAVGQPLSLFRSLVRALVFTFPWFVNGLRFPLPTLGAALGTWASGVLLFGVVPASVVTFFLSRRAHQTVHDLVVGSYVVEEYTLGRPVVARTRRALATAAAAWVLLVAVGTGVMSRATFLSPPNPMMEKLASLPNVSNALVKTSTVLGLLGKNSGQSRTIVQVQVWYRGPESQVGTLTHNVASAVLWHGSGLSVASVMQVTITQGWDLGVASWTTSKTEMHSLDEWRAAD
jgi:uncharacterized RDD family membrane protein YckC